MVWDCPKCGLVNPPEAQFCDCGYDVVAKRVDREHAPKASGSPHGFFATYRYLRLGLGGFAAGTIGIILLVWELSEKQPETWNIIRALLLVLFGFGFVGFLIWHSNKSR
jgi:drug/metabolite transporter (DMT)-like permease